LARSGADRGTRQRRTTANHPLGLVPSQTPSRDHRARDRAPRSSRHLSRIRRAHGRARAPHTPHELSEPGAGTTHRERTLELLATLLLSIATVGIAWSGYQAARWSGIEARHYAEANTARTLANRASTAAGQDRLQDLLNFNRWLDASTQGNATLTRVYEARFRPEFRPAFQAWLLQDPLNNPAATPSPLLMPQYHPQEAALVNQLERKADRAFTGGRDATERTDAYVFSTVFFASVLFFAGISMRFAWLEMRIVVLGLGGLCLVYALIRVASLPIG
jgi:hypothetical protein